MSYMENTSGHGEACTTRASGAGEPAAKGWCGWAALHGFSLVAISVHGSQRLLFESPRPFIFYKELIFTSRAP